MIGKIKGSLDIRFQELKAEEEKISAQYSSLKESLANTEQNIKLTDSTKDKWIADNLSNLAEIESEKVDAYELGAKGTFGRFNINLALFQMDLTDFQVLEFTGVQFTTFNVNNARSRGFEIEAFGRVHDYISLNTSVTYAKAEYGDDCDTGVSAANLPSVQLLCGQTLTNAPEWAGVVGLTYDGPLNSSGSGLLANGNVSY